MKHKIFFLIIFMIFNIFKVANANDATSVYDFSFRDINGTKFDLNQHKGKVLVVVNVASRCGFTNQYKDLQIISDKYKESDVIVLGIPTNNFKQEPGTNKDIKDFCETNFGITFPITEKINVIGSDAHPFYKWAKKTYGLGAVPKWNFHKIIINKKGQVANTFSSITNPSSRKFMAALETEIKN